MKAILKILFASLVGGAWYVLSGSQEIGFIFFFVILFAMFFKPFKSNNTAIRDQYIEKLKENIKKNQEVNEQFQREKNVTYRDFRKKEK